MNTTSNKCSHAFAQAHVPPVRVRMARTQLSTLLYIFSHRAHVHTHKRVMKAKVQFPTQHYFALAAYLPQGTGPAQVTNVHYATLDVHFKPNREDLLNCGQLLNTVLMRLVVLNLGVLMGATCDEYCVGSIATPFSAKNFSAMEQAMFS
eukprot:2322278-Amphidinium_carterae.1